MKLISGLVSRQINTNLEEHSCHCVGHPLGPGLAKLSRVTRTGPYNDDWRSKVTRITEPIHPRDAHRKTLLKPCLRKMVMHIQTSPCKEPDVVSQFTMTTPSVDSLILEMLGLAVQTLFSL
ncbi:uncharacterized protein ARMOST_16793 [Armillaria ostoyae]|uniref:Uncharacterized protein n=1 Tax=Armillaria ostoyae TaxID=47428 RepID=A0A284RX61_ARMOS|nr:uncharacterized protein ARMOST_16793 [Armillaria ostoyae]